MAGFSVPNFQMQKSPFDLNEALSSAIKDRMMKAKIAEQEAKNPYAGDREAEALSMDRNKNKYYGENIESEIDNRNASSRHLDKQTEYLPLDMFTKANNSIRSNSRFGKSYEFMRALNAKSAPDKALWIAQHQEEYDQMLSDLGSGNSSTGGSKDGSTLAQKILLHELQQRGQSISDNEQQGQYTDQNEQQGQEDQQDQNPEQQQQAQQQYQPETMEQAVQRQMQAKQQAQQQQGGQQAQSIREQVQRQMEQQQQQRQQQEQQSRPQQSPVAEGVTKQLPLEDQPKSKDPLIADAQQALSQEKQKFLSTKTQSQQAADQNLLYSTRKLNTGANNARADGANVMEHWLQSNRTPEIVERFRNVASLAGWKGDKIRSVQSYLPDSMQSQAYKDWNWYHDQFVPNTVNIIKTMEKLNGDMNQRDELTRMSSVLTNPKLGPEGALQEFNRSISSLQDISQNIFDSSETPAAKGIYKRMYNLPDKYDEYITSKPESKSKSDGKGDTQSLAQMKEELAKLKSESGSK